MGLPAIKTYIEAGGGSPIHVPTGINWQEAANDIKSGSPELAAAVSAYFKDLKQQGSIGYGAKSTRPGHIPGGLPSMPDIEVGFYGPEQDDGILSAFRYVDKTQSKNPTFQFAHLSAQAVVFEQAKEGEPAKIRKVSGGTPTALTSVKWHGALGIDDDAARFDDYGIYEENVQRVPAVWNDTMVDTHASLVTALGAGIDETWDTDLITTLNSAGAQIVEDCGDVYGLPDNPTLILYYNHRRWGMVLQAMTANLSLPNDNNSAKQLQWNIIPVSTRKITTTNLYLTLPGYDNVTVEWDGLYSEFGRDFMRGADAQVWRARMNAGIGNTQQWRRITPA